MCMFASCGDSEDVLPGNWTRESNFAGTARTGAVAFTIDGRAYVGTGSDGTNRLNDFWQYNPESDAWVRMADFPGVARSGAVGFAANGKGYIGTGYDGTDNLSDFWEFDPATNTWTQIADFPGTARFGAVAMTLENKGYLAAGYDGSYRKDFWQYDPATAVWTEKTELSGARRVNGYAFVVDGKGYIGGGLNNGILEADIMEYSPATDTWRNLRSLTSSERSGTAGTDFPSPRTNATVFVSNNRAYLLGGTNVTRVATDNFQSNPTNAAAQNDAWEYNPATDTWRALSGATRAASRESAVAFSIGDVGYIGLGRNGTTRSSEIWQYEVRNDD
ncbi:Kelch repeat-containing protein [Pontibacter pamirensis]|uniref:Kelch repeat-containing protein n=1 Tax=Pontibacter pamirensis TaxID=2562824 RepID=UPI001F1D7983|nr:kelch repeat-containing protein [Pontibacter pamirensis]